MENTGAQQKLTNVVGINQEVVIGGIAVKDVTPNLPFRYGNYVSLYLKFVF